VLAVSLTAYVLVGVALFGFLRMRFGPATSLAASGITLLFPPLQRWSFHPMTDSAGLVAVLVALTMLALTVRDGRRWLMPWMLVIGIGSFTRESVAVPVIAAALLAFRRVTRALALFTTGVLATAPASLLLGYSYKLAFAESSARQLSVPIDASTAALAEHWVVLAVMYPIWEVYDQPIWTAVLVLSLVLFVRRRTPTVVDSVTGASAAAALIYLATFPIPTNLRLEFVFIPAAAYGIALAVQAAFSLVTRANQNADGSLRPVRNLGGWSP
jgi:hypothetical protein